MAQRLMFSSRSLSCSSCFDLAHMLKLFSSLSSFRTNLLYLLWYDNVFIAYCLLLAGGWVLYASYWWEAGTSAHSTLSLIVPIHHQEGTILVQSRWEHGIPHSMPGDKLCGIVLLAIPAIRDISLVRSHLSHQILSLIRYLSWEMSCIMRYISCVISSLNRSHARFLSLLRSYLQWDLISLKTYYLLISLKRVDISRRFSIVRSVSWDLIIPWDEPHLLLLIRYISWDLLVW